MDILYLLIPMSVVLVFLIMGLFAWAIQSGQFDDLEREGERIFEADDLTTKALALDRDQGGRPAAQKQSLQLEEIKHE